MNFNINDPVQCLDLHYQKLKKKVVATLSGNLLMVFSDGTQRGVASCKESR